MTGAISSDRLLRLMAATQEQQEAIDRILEGKAEAPRPAPSGPLLMMMGDGAKLLGVSRATVWRLIKVGRLERVEILPGTFRVRRADIEAIVDGKERAQ